MNKSTSLKIVALTLMCDNTLSLSNVFAEGSHDHSHHNDHAGAHWASPKEAAERKNPIPSSKSSINKGALLYSEHCVSCHGVNAEGDSTLAKTLTPKPTNLKAMSGGHTDGDFAWKIANGRGAMPAWKDTLSKDDIWDLVNFIQSLKDEATSHNSKHDHKNHKH